LFSIIPVFASLGRNERSTRHPCPRKNQNPEIRSVRGPHELFNLKDTKFHSILVEIKAEGQAPGKTNVAIMGQAAATDA
jgi:hypothetical protein